MKGEKACSLVTLFLWVLAACSRGIPSPVLSPSGPPPRATLSPTRLFSATPSPPLLSLPAKTPASLTPSPTLPPPTSPTQDLVATIQAAGKPEVLQSSSSPDGKWRGEVVRYGCLQVSDKDRLAFEQILLFQAGSQAGQIVDSRLQSCEDMGDYSFRIEFWSSDGRYLYYTNAQQEIQERSCQAWEQPLVRLEVDSGEKLVLGLGPLSPDRSMFVTPVKNGIAAWSIDRGEVARFPLAVPGAHLFSVAWSPEGKAMAYLLTENNCEVLGPVSIAQIDLAQGRQTLLLRYSLPFKTLAWEKPGFLKLNTQSGEEWSLDLASNDIRPVSPSSSEYLAQLDVHKTIYPSPGGKWKVLLMWALPPADGSLPYSFYYQQVTVFRSNWSKIWNPVSLWSNWGLGYTLPAVIGWSDTSIYLADRVIPDGCPIPGWVTHARRMDLQTGQVIPLLNQNMLSATVSPDGHSLAYFGERLNNPTEIVIQNLENGKEKRAPFAPSVLPALDSSASWDANYLHWSPDSRALLFSITSPSLCEPADQVQQSIFRFDLSTSTFHKLLDRSGQAYTILDWPLENQALLADPGGKDWWLDVDTGEISERKEE